MFWSKIRLFVVKHKLHHVVLATTITILLVLIFKLFILPNGYFYQSEYVSVWGTLFGTIIGGVFTLWGTQIASQKEIQGKFYIKQKNEILSPLYDELKEIHDVILHKNPYPLIVGFEKSSQTMIAHPQYSVWGEIKIDTRFFEVPSTLVAEMEKLYKAINEYISYRQIAAASLVDTVNNVLYAEIGIKCPIVNLGDSLLPSMANGQSDYFFQKANNILFLGNEQSTFDITEEQKENVYKEIFIKCNELQEIIQIKSIYSIWLEQETQVIELLRILIESINYRYHE